jgi:hypothetical protein
VNRFAWRGSMRRLFYAIARPLLPVRLKSRLYLADRLARIGVDVKRIPTPCMQELADDVITTVKSIAALSGQRWSGDHHRASRRRGTGHCDGPERDLSI